MLRSTSHTRVAGFWRSCARDRRLVTTLGDVFSSPWRTRPVRVQTVNLQHVHLIATSQTAADAAASADLVSADGWPLAVLARRAGLPCERVTGREIVDALLHDRALAGSRVAMLGSRAEVAARFAELLAGNDVRLVHARHGDAGTWDVPAVAAEVAALGCDVVLVALGAPRGEPIAEAVTRRLPRGLVVGIGGAVDMVTGHLPAAPRWVGRVGLEWLFRLAGEPRRLGRRYLVESPRALLVLLQVLARTWT